MNNEKRLPQLLASQDNENLKILAQPPQSSEDDKKINTATHITVLVDESTLVCNKVGDAISYNESEQNNRSQHSGRRKRRRVVCCASIGLLLLFVVVAAVVMAIALAVLKNNSSRKTNQDGLLGDWVECTDSLQCNNGCCSGTFSDGVYKCTSLDGGYLPGTCIGGSSPETSREDWAECNSSLQCTNGCCSNAYSEGFWKCTPLIGGYLGDPDTCISHAEESQGWEKCIVSDECSTGCCSSTYSEGVPKCTPLVGGYRSDSCT